MDKPLIVRPLDCCKGSDMLTDGADCNISMSVQISASCVPGLASHQYAEDLGVTVSWPWKSASPIKGMKWATAVSPPKQKPAPEDCAEYCCANAFGVAAPWSGTESSNRNGEKEAPATLLLARQNASLEACVHPPITICQCLWRCTSLALQAQLLAERREMGCGRGSWHRNLPIFQAKPSAR